MTAQEYRDAIEELGLSQVKAARLFGVADRTSRRWAACDEIPRSVQLALDLMIEYGVDPSDWMPN